MEAIAIGWLYGTEKLRKYINDVSSIKIGKWWSISIKYVTPIVLIILLATTVHRDIKTPYENYPQWALLTKVF